MQDLERSGLQADKEHLDGEQELHDVFHDDVEGEGGQCPHFPLVNSPGALLSDKGRTCEHCHRSWQDLVMKDPEKSYSVPNTLPLQLQGEGVRGVPYLPGLTTEGYICLQRFGRKRWLDQSLPTMGIYTLRLHQ